MLRVTSEVGRLRTVLVHEPGPEVDQMVPAMMEELLFDDILFGERVREEHRRFRRLMQLLGIEVLDAQDLLVETLGLEEAREWLFEVVLPELPPPVRGRLRAAGPQELVDILVTGARSEAGSGIAVEDLYALPPVPNWCFQRDPQVIIGEGAVMAAMATPARWREAILSRVIFRFHPRLADAPILDPLMPERERPLFLGLHRPRLEGGDVLVLSPEVVAVGLSERTNTVALECLARSLGRLDPGPRWLVVVQLPRRRAYMHLDTVFTMIDRGMALAAPQVILPGSGETAVVAVHDLRDAETDPAVFEDFATALGHVGLEIEMVPCGGADPLAQQREQWTDGANALALAPGVITLYDRNVRTTEELSRRGFRIVHAEDVLLGRDEVRPDAGERICILLESHEISRARGGPHCLSHPLVRDDL